MRIIEDCELIIGSRKLVLRKNITQGQCMQGDFFL